MKAKKTLGKPLLSRRAFFVLVVVVFFILVTLLTILFRYLPRLKKKEIIRQLPELSQLESTDSYTCRTLIHSEIAGLNNPDDQKIKASIWEKEEIIKINVKGETLFIKNLKGLIVRNEREEIWKVIENTNEQLIAFLSHKRFLNDTVNVFILDKTNGVAIYTEGYSFLFQNKSLIAYSAYLSCSN